MSKIHDSGNWGPKHKTTTPTKLWVGLLCVSLFVSVHSSEYVGMSLLLRPACCSAVRCQESLLPLHKSHRVKADPPGQTRCLATVDKEASKVNETSWKKYRKTSKEPQQTLLFRRFFLMFLLLIYSVTCSYMFKSVAHVCFRLYRIPTTTPDRLIQTRKLQGSIERKESVEQTDVAPWIAVSSVFV